MFKKKAAPKRISDRRRIGANGNIVQQQRLCCFTASSKTRVFFGDSQLDLTERDSVSS
jgi:hypothetical protein